MYVCSWGICSYFESYKYAIAFFKNINPRNLFSNVHYMLRNYTAGICCMEHTIFILASKTDNLIKQYQYLKTWNCQHVFNTNI